MFSSVQSDKPTEMIKQQQMVCINIFFWISSIFFPTNETTAAGISLEIPEKDKEKLRFPSSQLTWI
jgi:hypothetical protein